MIFLRLLVEWIDDKVMSRFFAWWIMHREHVTADEYEVEDA